MSSSDASARGRTVYAARVIGILLLAALVRWQLVVRAYLLPNSDQAMVGLMARHILAGERPIFYWGQPYNGTLEPYLTALSYRLGAGGDGALHLAPILCSLLFVYAVTLLGQLLYGRRLALLCGLVLAFGPADLMAYSVWPGYSYLQAMAFGTLAFAVALATVRSQRWWQLSLVTLLLGLALWAQPLAIAYVAGVLVLLVVPIRHALRAARGRIAVLGSLVAAGLTGALGLAPVLIANAQTPLATLRFLTSRHGPTQIDKLEAARRAVAWAGPVLLGIIPPFEDPSAFRHYIQVHLFSYLLALGVLILAAVLVIARWSTIVRWLRSLLSPVPAGEGALLMLAFSLCAGYLLSNWSSSQWSASDPRYLLPLYTLLPLALRGAIPRPESAGRLRRAAGAALLCLLVGMGIAANAVAAPTVDNVRPLAAVLETQGIRAVYGDYWLVYRLAYVSDERLIPVVLAPDLTLGLNRYSPYLAQARASRHAAWVVSAGSVMERDLEACLGNYHASTRPTRYGSYVIIDAIHATSCGMLAP